MSNDILQTKCDACSEVAHEPFIECCECDSSFCTTCFSSGREVNSHKNDHRYSVRRNDFPLFENCNWSAKEECKLLSALSAYGYGNWEEISKSVHTRSKLECQEHYKKYYIENVQYEELKLLPETKQSLFPRPVIPYLYSTEVTTNPPRNNQGDQHLAGYNAHRSEFELSYDHNAEGIFSIENNYSDEEEDDDDCMDSLKIALVNSLNTRLRERQRRYQIIKNHGLIMPSKLASWVRKFDSTMGRQKCERLLSFMQLMSGMQFDAFMEGLSLECEIMQRILRLGEYRKYGIRTLYAANIYKQLKREDTITMKELQYATQVMKKKFEGDSPVKSKLFGKDNKKFMTVTRCSMPLEIFDLPGFHLLSDCEKVLCANLRLVPKKYMEFKELLITENNKMGFLRLLDARRIVKIDVNKTRKIYDYLVAEGFLNKPL